MRGNGLDVVLQQVDIRKDGIVNALQHIVGRGTCGGHLIGIIDKSVAQGGYRLYGSIYQKFTDNGFESFFVHVFMIYFPQNYDFLRPLPSF